MISVYQAENTILNNARPLGFESVLLAQAQGRLLREDIRSDRDQPAFDKSLVDGIAIHTSSYDKGSREFFIEATIAAGDGAYTLKNNTHCVRIMTGAMIPKGCNAVIPAEQVNLEPDKASLKAWTLVKSKQNIRFKASGCKKGQILLKSSSILSSPQIGILAAVGKSKVKVTLKPRIAIISTGDELVDVHKQPKPYQTRTSNSYALKAMLDSSGLATGTIFHYPDNKAALIKGIGKNLKDFDMLILSGGVSMGEFDYVPEVLKTLGVKSIFHKIAQKPGKPMWFGKSRSGKIVFALPGNPISTQICAYRYIIPFLKKSTGLKINQDSAMLPQGPDKPGDLTLFLPVRTIEKNGTRFAEIITTGGSDDFGALAQSDGFIEYDQNQKPLRPYFSWRL